MISQELVCNNLGVFTNLTKVIAHKQGSEYIYPFLPCRKTPLFTTTGITVLDVYHSKVHPPCKPPALIEQVNNH